MEREVTKRIFDSLQCGVIVIDAETNLILNINKQACEILQLDQSIVGSPCKKLLCNNEEECEFRKNPDQIVNHDEICFMTKLHKRRWLLRTAKTIIENKKRYIIESFTNITQQKVMEQNYIDLLNYAPAGIYQLDLKTLEYRSANKVILEYTGYSEEEFKDKGLFVVLTDDSKSKFLERMEKLKNGEEVPTEVEYEIETKEGKRYWVLLNVRFIYNGDKVPNEAFCIVTDITKRKDAEIKLTEEKDKLQTYLDMTFDIVVALDLNGNIILINKAGCIILGTTEDKLLGLNWFDNFVLPDDIQGAKNEFSETVKGLNGEKERAWSNFIITTKGEKRFIRWRNKPVKDRAGQIVGTFSTGDDITDDYKAEKALLKLWDKTQEELGLTLPEPFRRRSEKDRNNKLDQVIELISNHTEKK
jgi:PAS domain S-box-containing protein